MQFNKITKKGRAVAATLMSGMTAFAVVIAAPNGAADPAVNPSFDNSPPKPIIHPDPDDPSVPYRPDITPLPQVVPTRTNWAPKFPFPFDKMRGEITDADITAEAEMCQWFTAQFDTLATQINTLTYLLAGANRGRYGVDGIDEKADIVTANIFQSADFLSPRAQALTQNTDFAGDVYFPLYQGENFYRLWQQLHNVGIGIQSRQPSWGFGPPRTLMEHYASGIRRSHVCR